MMYFSFTTMSTVGFGDFHPENEYEMIAILLILIFGNAIFTFVISDIVGMIGVMKNFY